MLSVAESAEQLGVSPARVRALIKDGRLPAVKNGREWVLREEDVLQRLMEHPQAGRPRGCAAGRGQWAAGESEKGLGSRSAHATGTVPSMAAPGLSGSALEVGQEAPCRARELYDECRRQFEHLPSAEVMAAARSREEASFYMAVFDFFLQQRQRELIREGVF